MSGNPIIMVVDDQPDLVDGVKLILEVEGYEVWTAGNGQHALDKLESAFMRRNEQGDGSKSLPDLVLSDIMMPVMDGYTLFERVKANPYLQDIPFIFLTAKVDDVDIRRGKELGADDYITKPAQPDDLLSSIRGRLKKTAGIPGNIGAAPLPPSVSPSQSNADSSSNMGLIIAVAVIAILIIVAVVFFVI